jgi:ribonuclease-3
MQILQTQLNYAFKNPRLLQQALTHSSYTHEQSIPFSNERLEFLGDAVLELTVSDLLYKRYPDLSEGELTKRRAALVCEPSLAALARKLELGGFLQLGHGEKMSGGNERDSLLSDALEAVIGAIYLDGGMDSVKEIIHTLFVPIIEKSLYSVDHKTVLQETIQKTSREPLVYTIIDETGPAHKKEFTAEVSHKGQKLGMGMGRSKKEAEQNAAMVAMQRVGN